MAKVRILTTKDHSTKALKTLHTAGVLHVKQSEELRPVGREALEHERKEITGLLTDIDNVLACIPKGEIVSLGEGVEVIYTRPLDEIDSEIRSLCTRLSNMHRRAAKLEEDVKELRELSKYLGSLGQQADISLSDLDFSGAYLFSRVFLLPNEAYHNLYHTVKDYLLESIAVALENESAFYVVARVEDKETIQSAVRSGGGRILQIPKEGLTVRQFVEVAATKVGSFEEEVAKLYREIESKTRENLQKLVLFREALSAEAERLAVLEKACEAKYVTLIEGWIPESDVESTIATL